MVIVELNGGLGNQLYQYAFGMRLARKLNTELKLTFRASFIPRDLKFFVNYRLGDFNIQENFATPEEIKHVKETGIIPKTIEEFESAQGGINVFIQGNWMFTLSYYKELYDILRKEFTLKKPFSPKAEAWKEKILAAENSVSLHIRRGDYIYNQGRSFLPS